MVSFAQWLLSNWCELSSDGTMLVQSTLWRNFADSRWNHQGLWNRRFWWSTWQQYRCIFLTTMRRTKEIKLFLQHTTVFEQGILLLPLLALKTDLIFVIGASNNSQQGGQNRLLLSHDPYWPVPTVNYRNWPNLWKPISRSWSQYLKQLTGKIIGKNFLQPRSS